MQTLGRINWEGVYVIHLGLRHFLTCLRFRQIKYRRKVDRFTLRFRIEMLIYTHQRGAESSGIGVVWSGFGTGLELDLSAKRNPLSRRWWIAWRKEMALICFRVTSHFYQKPYCRMNERKGRKYVRLHLYFCCQGIPSNCLSVQPPSCLVLPG